MMISNIRAGLGLLSKQALDSSANQQRSANFGLLTKQALDSYLKRVLDSIAALVIVFLAGLLFLMACNSSGTGRDEAINEATVPIGNEPAQKEATREGEAPTTNGSRVGGSLVIGVRDEPDTLDAHKTAMGISDQIMSFVGASLVTLDPDGKVVPYLAESWETSEDGLTWTFKLKPGITFHDGTPFTAQDYVYTIERAINPETASPAAGTIFGPVARAVAVDDETLVITLTEPFFPFLTGLTASGYLMPLAQAAVETRGDDYGRQPMSVGSYIFKEWRTGEAIILERNPDFNWGPAFTQDGPYNIERIEFRFLPDPTTLLTALEAGEIDQAKIVAKDVELIRANGRFELYKVLLAGASPMGMFNVSQPPFDDVRVRQAFNLAVNRRGLIQVAVQGQAEPQYGPISPTVLGYWPGVEEIGYDYDLDRARALLAEAGYRPDAAGILEKDGRPLRFPLLASVGFATEAEVLVEQYKAIGADLTIEVLESGIAFERSLSGDYQLMLIGIEYPEADVLYLLYHSTKGSVPVGQLSDMELNEILDKTHSTVDPQERQEWVNRAQARIVKEAYMLPLYAPTVFTAVSKQVKGLMVRPDGSFIYNDAYIVDK